MTKKISIHTVDGWILNKCAFRLDSELKKLGFDSSVCSVVGDVNIYMDIQNCYTKPTEGLDIGIFTHLHEDDLRHFQNHWLSCDRIVCMGRRYYRDIKMIYPENRLSYCVMAEPPPFQTKKTKVGIFQRGVHEGKGFNFMLSLPDDNIKLLKEFKFIFVGSGWDKVVDKYSNLGIDCSYHEDESYSSYDSLYEGVDYVLVPSKWEGGPMSIVEAYTKGIPVISSDVGFAIEDLEIDHIFSPGDEKGLTSIFESVRMPVRRRRNRIAGISMSNFANHIQEIINEGN